MDLERWKQVDSLLQSVLEHKPEHREAFLRNACAGDDALEGEVLSLLRMERDAGSFLQTPVIGAAQPPDFTGKAVSHYSVIEKLGEGGMGSVWKARDTRLNRIVALKFLPGAMMSDPERKRRFVQEARAASALNHPHIVTIYEIEQAAPGGQDFIAMEFVPGKTLSSLISTKSVRLKDTLPLAVQIADALAAAHNAGIIHRDLKPGNIMVTGQGLVKVLDFGLAKFLTGIPGCQQVSRTEIAGRTETAEGVILGTVSYMSPEQAEAKRVDARSDIFSFGAVLYEMVTGLPAFTGDSMVSILSAVLRDEPPPPRDIVERLPQEVDRIITRCLRKDPGRRYQHAGDLKLDIEQAGESLAASGAADTGTRLRAPWWWLATAVLAITTVLAVWAPWRKAETGLERASPRLDLDLGADVRLAGDAGPAIALSPDGTRIVFVSQDQNGVSRLFHRRLDQPGTALLSGTDGASQPFFSPDGQWVGFFAQGKLRKTRIDGGEPISLCDAPSGRGATWGEDGSIIAALNTDVGLSQVPSGGGNVVPLTELARGEVCHRWPHVLPGGKFVLFTASSLINNFEEAAISLVGLQDHRRKVILPHAGMYPKYLPSGHLVYVTKGNLFAAPFDLNSLQVGGAGERLGEVAADTPRGFAQVDFSGAGICALRVRGGQGLSTPQWLDSAGKTEPLGLEVARYHYLRLSPDGSRLAYVSTQGSSSDLFVYDWQRSIKTRLTSARVTRSPAWTRDGRFIAFAASGGLFATLTGGGGTPEQMTQSNNQQTPEAFSPDGQRLIITDSGAKGEIRIAPVKTEGGQMHVGEPQTLFKTPNRSEYASFSPDGRWLAYSTAEGGAYQVYVRAVPDKGTQVQVSNAGGLMPIWSRNAHELFYRTEDQRIMVVSYSVRNDSFTPDRPRIWYGRRLANIGTNWNLDLAPDGKRFVVLMPADGAEARQSQSHITLVINFFDEVRRRVAGRAN